MHSLTHTHTHTHTHLHTLTHTHTCTLAHTCTHSKHAISTKACVLPLHVPNVSSRLKWSYTHTHTHTCTHMHTHTYTLMRSHPTSLLLSGRLQWCTLHPSLGTRDWEAAAAVCTYKHRAALVLNNCRLAQDRLTCLHGVDCAGCVDYASLHGVGLHGVDNAGLHGVDCAGCVKQSTVGAPHVTWPVQFHSWPC